MAPVQNAFNRPKKLLTKSVSLDHFGARDSYPTSEDEDVGGGAPLGLDSFLSPLNAKRPASSGMAEHRTLSSRRSFQVGNSPDDDVFVEKAKVKEDDAGSIGDDAPPPAGSLALAKSDVPNEGPLSLLHIDAQNIYPPTACLFAANLPAAFDDDKLEVEITRHLSQFGSVFVKIRRDNRQMPFAFCQFTCDADARMAEKNGSGAGILGRPIRLEMAKAHATWIVYKVSGKATSKEEAMDLLGGMGEIARASPLDERMRLALRLPPAIVIQFRMYDPKRDIEKRFNNHRFFRVRAFEPKAADPVPDTGRNPDSDAMLQYDRDRRSAYIGNLPPTTTDTTLRRLVSAWGQVVNVDLKRKFVPAGPNRSIEICFAFLEFTRPDAVDEVASAMNGMNLEGYTVRAERKQSHFLERPRRNFTMRAPIPSRPHSQNRSQAQNWREPMAGRHARDTPGGQPALYSRSFSTPFAHSAEGSSSRSAGNTPGHHLETADSDVYHGGAYHQSLHHAPSMSSALASRPPPISIRGNALSDTMDTPKAVKFEGLGDSDDECDHSEYGDKAGEDRYKGAGRKATANATVESPRAATAGPGEISGAEAVTPAAYPMMPPPISPYGYSNMTHPMNHPLMHTPITPQGPIFYNQPYPGYGYTPMATPIEAYLYAQQMAMLTASYHEASRSPTRPAGPQFPEESGNACQYFSSGNGQDGQDEAVKDSLDGRRRAVDDDGDSNPRD